MTCLCVLDSGSGLGGCSRMPSLLVILCECAEKVLSKQANRKMLSDGSDDIERQKEEILSNNWP